MAFVSFAELKARLTIEQVATDFLGLQLTKSGSQLRGMCPVCEGDKRGLAITPDKGLFHCFSGSKGGDFISLAAHVLNVSMRDAAVAIDKHFTSSQAAYSAPGPGRTDAPKPTPPTSPPSAEAPSELRSQLEKVRARLDHGHEILGLMGFPEVVWRSLGIGFDPRAKRVMFPLYKNGELVGYAGLATDEEQSPLVLLHKNLLTICAVPQQEQPKADAKNFLRVVK